MSNYVVVDTDVFSCLWQGRAISPRFTAIFYGAPLITNNTRHFRSVPGLDLIDP